MRAVQKRSVLIKVKKNYLKVQLEISVFGNHAASRKSDKLLSATEQRQANGRNKEWPMRAVQKRSVLIQVKKNCLKMQLVISVFGNHAASRDGDDYLIYLYNIAPESNI